MLKHKLLIIPTYTKDVVMFRCEYCGFEITIPDDILYDVLVNRDTRIARDYAEIDVLTRSRVRICTEPDKRRMHEAAMGDARGVPLV